MDKVLIVFLLAANSCSVSALLKLKDLRVPSSIENGTINSVILDCDFEAEGEDGLTVKWFYNKPENQIYQWIPTVGSPQALGSFKDKVEVGYKVSNNKYTMYRALFIKEITPSISGAYTCTVSSFENEITETKKMIIYVPSKTGLELIHIEEAETVFCLASGIYPKPKVIFGKYYRNSTNSEENNSRGDKDDDDDDDDDDVYDSDDDYENDDDDDDPNNGIYLTEDKTYNVSLSLKYEKDNLTGPVDFVCNLTIPGTNYRLEKVITYYPDDYDDDDDGDDETEEESPEVSLVLNTTDSSILDDSDNENDDDDDDDDTDNEDTDDDDDDDDDIDNNDKDDNDDKNDNKKDNDNDTEENSGSTSSPNLNLICTTLFFVSVILLRN